MDRGRSSEPPAGSSIDDPEVRRPLAQHAYEWIKARILVGELPPGSVVVATQLAAQLGMSQTPVHEALKMLCSERLAHVIPRTGYGIAQVTVNDVQEIFQLRLALEPLAVNIGLQRATAREIAEFADRLARAPGMVEGVDPSSDDGNHLHTAADVHDAFHLAVAGLSGQDRLIDIIRDLLHQGRRLMLTADASLASRPDPAFPRGAHRQIADAIVACDRKAAVDAVTAHVRSAHWRVVESLAPYPSDRAAMITTPPRIPN